MLTIELKIDIFTNKLNFCINILSLEYAIDFKFLYFYKWLHKICMFVLAWSYKIIQYIVFFTRVLFKL